MVAVTLRMKPRSNMRYVLKGIVKYCLLHSFEDILNGLPKRYHIANRQVAVTFCKVTRGQNVFHWKYISSDNLVWHNLSLMNLEASNLACEHL